MKGFLFFLTLFTIVIYGFTIHNSRLVVALEIRVDELSMQLEDQQRKNALRDSWMRGHQEGLMKRIEEREEKK